MARPKDSLNTRRLGGQPGQHGSGPAEIRGGRRGGWTWSANGMLPVFLDYFFPLIISSPPELRKFSSQVYVKKFLNFPSVLSKFATYTVDNLGRRFAAALLPRLFGTNPRSHHKGATGRVRTGDQRLPVLCHCQLGQDIPTNTWKSIV